MSAESFSTPSSEVRGPQDLVARMNEATSEDWEKIPLPARQQLGYHERLADARSGNGINEATGKSPEELFRDGVDSNEGLGLSRAVTYHLESTPPPAEPAGAPGSDGYNRLNRQVPPADGFEVGDVAKVEQGPSVRTLRLPEGVGLSEEEQAKIDGVGPHAPSPAGFNYGSYDNARESTRQVIDETYSHPDQLPDNAKLPAESDGDDLPLEKTDAEPTGPAESVAEQAGETSQAGSESDADADDQSGAGSEPDDDDAVPSGSIAEVMAWVGDDASKARQAERVESQKSSPRSSLLSQLESIR